MFQAGFIALAMLETGFFVYRRKVDPLAVAFGSAIIYFTPGLLGFSVFLYRDGTGGFGEYLQPIAPSAHVAMSLVILSLALGAVIADRLPKISLPQIGGQRLVPGILFAFALGAAAVSVWRTGAYYLCTDKAIVLQKVDLWYSYAALTAPLCVVAAVAMRNWIVAALGTVLLLADLYAGFRAGIAISLLSLAMLFEDWIKGGRRRLVVYVLAIVAAGFLLFVVKQLISPIKYAASSGCPVESARVTDLKSNAENVELVVANLTSSRFYWLAFLASEPSVTQAILNEVARTGFSTEAGYLIGQLSAGVPLGESLFGIDSRKVVSFDTMSQKKLFPNVAFSMANNPWAQALAAGGLWMVGIFAVAFTSLLVALNVLFWATSGAVRGGVAVTAAWIGFYFHRNDLFIEVVFLKHVVYIFAGALVIAWLASLILREQRPSHPTIK